MGCPYCEPKGFEHQVIEMIDLFRRDGASLTKQEARVMVALKAKAGIVTKDTLMDSMWFDRPTGEPESADSALKTIIFRCRGAIKTAGKPWRILAAIGIGYELRESKDSEILTAVGVYLAFTLAMIYPLARIIS